MQRPASTTPACAVALRYLLLLKVWQSHCTLLHSAPSSLHFIALGLSWSCAASGRRCPARGTVHCLAFTIHFAYLHSITLLRSGAAPNPNHISIIWLRLCFAPLLHFIPALSSLTFRPCCTRRASSILCAPPAGHRRLLPLKRVCSFHLLRCV